MMIQIRRNMLVAIDEMKLKASSPIIMVIKGAQMMIKAERTRPLIGNCRWLSWPKNLLHLLSPPKVTEKSRRPAL